MSRGSTHRSIFLPMGHPHGSAVYLANKAMSRIDWRSKIITATVKPSLVCCEVVGVGTSSLPKHRHCFGQDVSLDPAGDSGRRSPGD